MKKYILDTETSSIIWTGKNKKMTVTGDVDFEKGSFFMELDGKFSGSVKIDLSSIKISSKEDLDNDQEKKLIDHLASEDFFHVEKYPFLEYEIKEVTEKDSEHIVFGLLKVKDRSFGISTSAKIEFKETSLVAESSFKLTDINGSIRDKIAEGYDGEPIHTVEVEIYIRADVKEPEPQKN